MQFPKSILTIVVVIFVNCLPAQEILEIPDTGWRLWPDTAATWKNDSLYLPGEFQLQQLPVNPPTGGWPVLTDSQGIAVNLPATVEQFYWGEFGFRPYKNAYYFEREDDQVQNGNYRGVSWWWREVTVPKDFKGKQVTLFIRGARLRAEVYWNEQLVGYHLIGETSFTCDIGKVIRPGEKNLLAIRITNPGGRLDWVDTQLMNWGKYRFHASHGFGGLDRGLILRAHDPVFLADVWVLNTPAITRILPHATVVNHTPGAVSGMIRFEIRDPGQKNPLASGEKKIEIPAGGEIIVSRELDYPEADWWDLENPRLYNFRAILEIDSPDKNSRWKDRRETWFGFRWFDADGVGDNAVLRLNGKRMRVVSAISWGFWGMNGLWPAPDLAEREVRAAKAFGMNCINFHRNIGKAEVLDAQDRLGLLRFMEPGGGQTVLGEAFSMYAESPSEKIDTSGKNGDALTFAEKYMEEKIIRMVQDHRRHPSLVMYCIQNEIHPDLRNPRIFRVLRRMHAEDPSRIAVLKSGIPPRNQAWMRPYADSVLIDRGDGYSGWWDQHTVGGPGIWQDRMYKNPADFTHHSANDSEVVMWGEMLGAAVPDNHSRIIREIKARGGKSYDLKDHREILDAYEQFLTKWKFREAFPTAERLFLDIGDKSYDFWGRVIETSRLAEANDFLVISGWESTAIENHSGLLDNLRGFKGDPALIRKRLLPLRPVIKPRALVVETGKPALLDLFLLNETGREVIGEMNLDLIRPDGTRQRIGQFPIPAFRNDRFVYPLDSMVATPVFTSEGWYQLQLQIDRRPAIYSEEKILVVDAAGMDSLPKKVGVLADHPGFLPAVRAISGIQAEAYRPEARYDLVITSSRLLYGWRSVVDSTTEIQNTTDDVLYHTESWGWKGNLEYTFSDLPRGPAKVTLYFAEVTLSSEGARIFDVAINGRPVLEDFDIFKTAGGKNIAIDTAFTVPAPAGVVQITIPKRTVNYGKFSAIKIEAGDTIIAINAGGPAYRDPSGLVWQPYRYPVHLNDELLGKVRAGLPLLIIPEEENAAMGYGEKLGESGAITFHGQVGETRAPWMGSWYFVREHPVLEGLLVNQAMKSYYQAPVNGANGLLMEGENLDVFIGYGRDHDRNVGAAGFSARLEEGKILFHTLPGMIPAIAGESGGMQPVMARRLLINSMKWLMK